MKKIAIFILCLVIVLVGGVLFFKKTHPQNNQAASQLMATPSPISNPTGQAQCNPNDLEGIMSFEPAAGNIYGTFTIRNTSAQSCTIDGSAYLILQSSAQNITTSQQDIPGETVVSLAPGQTVYSKVHFPNGPQCSGQPISSDIAFTYPITSTQSLIFKELTGEATQSIQTCASPTEKTEVQIWSISNQSSQ